MEWSDISIRQYQALCREFDEKYTDEIERSIGLLSCLTGISIDDYQNKIPISELKKEFRKLEFIQTKPDQIKLHSKIRVGKYLFRFNLAFGSISAGHYIDLTELVKTPEKVNENLHLIIATLCERVNFFGKVKPTTVSERAEYLLHNMKMPYVFSLSAFFLGNYQNLTESIQDYLIVQKSKEMKKLDKTVQKVLSDIGVGTTL